MNPRWLRPGEWAAGGGGVVLFVALFLPWYSVHGPVGRDLTGWQAFSVIDILLALVAALGIALALTTAARRTPALPVALGVLSSSAGALATLLILIRLVDPPGPDQLLDLGAGAWIALAGAVLLTAGAWMSLADERNRGVPEPVVETRPAPPAA